MKEVQGKYTSAVIYTNDVDDYAVAQVGQLCDQEAFTDCKIRIMPDVHPGKVVPIGFTSTFGEKIMPAVVSVDIGCGVTMAKIKKGRMDFQKLDAVIRDNIPAGFSRRSKIHRFAEEFDFERLLCLHHIDLDIAKNSLGTLGGGNHFIEIDKDCNGELYIVIHSGSRHLGKEMAEYYLLSGKRVLEDKGIDCAYELVYLEEKLRDDYLHDMAVVQEFAAKNRRAILDELVKGMKWKVAEEIDCVHNYIDFGMEKPIVRKGAISAKKGETVIIPINMRDGVILGKGLGNAELNMSAPHGAGRLFSREQVKSRFTLSIYKKQMEGIYSSCIGKDTLDEAPFAYRDLDDILPYLKETVEVQEVLRPVFSFKAGGE